MTRFTDPQALTVDGQNLTVKTRPGLDLAAVAALPGLIRQAKQLLKRTSALLWADPLSPGIVELAHRYFLTGKGPSKSELKQMRFVVTATLTGLSGDVTLKVGKDISKDGDDPHGEVTRFRGDQGSRAYHTVVPKLGPTAFPWQKQKNWVRGAIKLRDETLTGPLGLVTLIHEATHKYAGTIDYCYFTDDGIKPDGTLSSRAKALANADSHAWFVVNVGKPEVWGTNPLYRSGTMSFDNPLFAG